MAKVTIDIKANDDASKKLEQVSKSMAALEKETQETSKTTSAATKIMQGFSGAMIAVNQGLELASKVAAAAKAAFDFAREGAAISQTTESFQRMATTVGKNANLLDELRAASRGTVDDMTLMAGTLTLTAGVSEDLGKSLLDSAPALMEIAKAANAVNPTLGDTAFMYESITAGIKRNSPLILDNLGIVVRVGEAQKAYADKLGKTVDQLSSTEQQQALLNDVLRAGENLLAQAGDSAESAVDSYDRLTASWKNYIDSVKAGSGAIGGLVNNAADMVEKWNDTADALDFLDIALKRGLINQKEYRTLVTSSRYATEDWYEAIKQARIEADELYNSLEYGWSQAVEGEKTELEMIERQRRLAAERKAAREELERTTAAVQANTAMQFDAYGVTLDLTDATARLAEEYRYKDAIIGAMNGTLGEQIQQIEDMAAEYENMSDWQKQWGAGKGMAEEIATGLESVNKQLLDMTVRHGVMTLLESGLEGGADAAYNLALKYGLIDQATYDTLMTMQNLDDFLSDTSNPDAYATAVGNVYENGVLLDGQVFTYTMVEERIYRERREKAGGYETGAGDINEMNATGTGGEFRTVPPGYPNDTFTMGLTSGEQYLVRSRNEVAGGMSAPSYTSGMGMGATPVINIIIQSTFAPDNEEQFKRMVRPAMVQLIREQGALT